MPVTVLTGYLGAGKTTLLNRILSETHGRRYAVVVNEFGELGVDGDLVVGADDDVFMMNNGCLCCTVRGDLIRVITDILDRAPDLDGILIETTGLAHPAPIAQTFFMDPGIVQRTRLDSFVAVADAKHLEQQIANGTEAEAQLASADLILLNKIDLVDTSAADACEALIRSINPSATVRRTTRSVLPVAELFDRNAFELTDMADEPHGTAGAPHHHQHRAGIGSVSLELDRPLLMERFIPWIDSLLAAEGEEIYRVKGILHFEGQHRRFLFQAVHRIADGDFLDPWPSGIRRSKLVFIGRALDHDRLRQNFEACRTRPKVAAIARPSQNDHISVSGIANPVFSSSQHCSWTDMTERTAEILAESGKHYEAPRNETELETVARGAT